MLINEDRLNRIIAEALEEILIEKESEEAENDANEDGEYKEDDDSTDDDYDYEDYDDESEKVFLSASDQNAIKDLVKGNKKNTNVFNVSAIAKKMNMNQSRLSHYINGHAGDDKVRMPKKIGTKILTTLKQIKDN
jgi:hypothetical protein